MCFFLTIAVPMKFADRVSQLFSRGFQVHPTKNQDVAAVLPSDFSAYLITSGMCSCDLYARPDSATNRRPISAEHLRRRYAKRGWSSAKIERAIQQAEAGQETLRIASSGLRPDVVDRVVRLAHAAGDVAILVHWYRGDVDTERVQIAPVGPLSVREFSSSCGSYPEDQLWLLRS